MTDKTRICSIYSNKKPHYWPRVPVKFARISLRNRNFNTTNDRTCSNAFRVRNNAKQTNTDKWRFRFNIIFFERLKGRGTAPCKTLNVIYLLCLFVSDHFPEPGRVGQFFGRGGLFGGRLLRQPFDGVVPADLHVSLFRDEIRRGAGRRHARVADDFHPGGHVPGQLVVRHVVPDPVLVRVDGLGVVMTAALGQHRVHVGRRENAGWYHAQHECQ